MSTTTDPVLSRSAQAQRKEASKRSAERRSSNALVKQLLGSLPRAAAYENAAQIVEDPDENTGAIPVGNLLMAIKGIGFPRATEILKQADVRIGDRRIRDLTDGQRERIAGVLRGRA